MVECYQPLTDSQWQVIAPLLPLQRKRRLRQVLDALRYICRTGYQWRSLPASFPPWPAVYYYFARWPTTGLLHRLNEAANRADRLACGRLPTPSRALVDAQSVKLAPRLGQQRGLDAHKRVKGRKRQVLCDTGGRIWQVAVQAASGHDSRTAHCLLPRRDQLRPAWASRLRIVLTQAGLIKGGLPGRSGSWAGRIRWRAGRRVLAGASCPLPNAGSWSAPSPGSTTFDASSWTTNAPQPAM